MIISSTVFPIFGTNIQKFFKGFIPETIWMEFSDFQFSRIEIWKSALSRISERPLFGWGPSTFSYLHLEKYNPNLTSEKIVEILV